MKEISIQDVPAAPPVKPRKKKDPPSDMVGEATKTSPVVESTCNLLNCLDCRSLLWQSVVQWCKTPLAHSILQSSREVPKKQPYFPGG